MYNVDSSGIAEQNDPKKPKSFAKITTVDYRYVHQTNRKFS